VSIGSAIFPTDARDREALFRIADERLYEAKNLGRNRVVGASV
jgi:GGDEF domain-containing protein